MNLKRKSAKKMQYKIPQNVQIEDKIVGPLTLKQLIYLGIGGGITYAIYTALASKYYIEVWIWFVAPPALLTLAFTFIKVNGIPFAKWILLMIEYIYNPKKEHLNLEAEIIMTQQYLQKTKKR